MKSLFETHLNLVGRVMDMQLQRQNVVMSNVANVKTPGYKPLKLEFEKQLQEAINSDARGKLSRTNEGHMPAAFDPETFGPEWEKAFKPRVVHGEDRVNLDKEQVLHVFEDDGPHPLDGVDIVVAASAGDGFIRHMRKRGAQVLLTGESDPAVAITRILAGEALPDTRFDITTTLCKIRDLFSKY